MFWFCSTSISLGKCVKSAAAQPDSTASEERAAGTRAGPAVCSRCLWKGKSGLQFLSGLSRLTEFFLLWVWFWQTLWIYMQLFFFRKGIFFAENEVNLEPTRILWRERGQGCTFTLNSILSLSEVTACLPSESVVPTPHCDFWLFLVSSKTPLMSPSLLC